MFVKGIVTSYKYGSKVQFTTYSQKAPERKLLLNKEFCYYRFECGYLPGTHKTVEQLRKLQIS
jgi:hypothetical protein